MKKLLFTLLTINLSLPVWAKYNCKNDNDYYRFSFGSADSDQVLWTGKSHKYLSCKFDDQNSLLFSCISKYTRPYENDYILEGNLKLGLYVKLYQNNEPVIILSCTEN